MTATGKRKTPRIKTPGCEIVPAAKKLRWFLMEEGMTIANFAIATGFSYATMANYICGIPNNYPSLAQAFAIEFVTKGYIKAWEWLENPYIENRIRTGQVNKVGTFETKVKSFVLKFNALKTVDGNIRQKARILSRLFGVQWGEVRQRAWADAREKAKLERPDLKMYFKEELKDEEV